MAGDLTLQLIHEAASSGLLHKLQLDMLDRKDALFFWCVIDGILSEKNRQYVLKELLVALNTRLLSAVAAPRSFKSADEDMMKILRYHRELFFPDKKHASSGSEDLISFWIQQFGDPEEFERNHAIKVAQEKANVVEAAKEKEIQSKLLSKVLVA